MKINYSRTWSETFLLGCLGGLRLFIEWSARRLCVACAVLAMMLPVLATPAAAADGESPLEVNLVALKAGPVVDGKETLVPAAEAKPGQTLVYRVTYHNRSAGELKNVAATVPVPAGLAYVGDSAQPAAEQATIDGKTFFPVGSPPKDTTPASWKELRWSPRPLAPGAEFTVELRARVESPAP